VVPGTQFLLSRRGFIALGLLLLPGFQSTPYRIEFLSFDRVEPLLANNRWTLPPGLTGNTASVRASWPGWLQSHDLEIRSRLLRGEEDTLANFVLFGVSFTGRPRVTPAAAGSETSAGLIAGRVQDFLTALATPNTDRLNLLKNLLTRTGYGTGGEAERERLRRYVTDQISRTLTERRQYEEIATRARSSDAASDSSPISALYRGRGVSVDTDFRPNYAIERALDEVKRRRLLRSVRRVAIVGAGLDFTDKDSGFDYYPLQTLQPFALIDSLLRLDMARVSDLSVTVFDISPQPLDHLSQAIARARQKEPYLLQLVLDRTPAWSAGARDYWRRMGDRVGAETSPMAAPSQIRNVERRAVRVRPEVVAALQPQALNIVAQHVEAPPGERFDLIVATNVLIYYDRFEQALALLNIESMLTPGGVFLTNDLDQDYPGLRLRTVSAVSTPYTPSQADDVRIYSVSTFQPQLAPQ
jgi:hypothetical protein